MDYNGRCEAAACVLKTFGFQQVILAVMHELMLMLMRKREVLCWSVCEGAQYRPAVLHDILFKIS